MFELVERVKTGDSFRASEKTGLISQGEKA